MKTDPPHIGVGATEELSLRVSVGALVRLLFDSPEDGRTMLALERTATVREIDGRCEVAVRAKPFGGAVRLVDPQALQRLIGDFHYDSERSRRERDFRLQVRPSSWEQIKEICHGHFRGTQERVLDASPERELAEEFQDSLRVTVTAAQYSLRPRGMIVQDWSEQTENVRAAGLPTVRIYYLFEAHVADPELSEMMLANSRRYSGADLRRMAREDAQRGGRGRANAVLVLRLDHLEAACRPVAREGRSGVVRVAGYLFDGNVLAVLQ
jgi:hypothetical protein